MGICFENRDKKRNKRQVNQMYQIKSGTKSGIIRIESDIKNLESEIKSMMQQLKMLQNTPGVSNIKIEELKRDILSKINSYKKCLNQKRILKNNLENIENKERENALAKQLEINNGILRELDDGNDEIIKNNNEYNLEQKNRQEMNDNILKEGDNMYIGMDKLKMDDEILNFLNDNV